MEKPVAVSQTSQLEEPLVTVIVCTRNRETHIGKMLVSLIDTRKPDIGWELLVVDNGSTDQTLKVLQEFEARLPIGWVQEPRAGLSFARNCGIANARGKYIIWTDDDIRVAEDWLVNYIAAFERHPDAAYFGGVIEPVFEGGLQPWLAVNLDIVASAFAKRDLGDDEREFSSGKGDGPYGANFAVRADVQRAHPYDVELGVSPTFKRLGEEAAVLRAIRAEGHRGFWLPNVRVKHIIPAERQSADYIFQYQFSAGETWAFMALNERDNFMGVPIRTDGRSIMGAPAWIWRKAISSGMRYYLSRRLAGPKVWLPDLMNHGYYRGALAYLRNRR